MERALKKEADPDASMKAIDFAYTDTHTVTAAGPPVFAVLGWFGSEKKIPALKLLKKHKADFTTRTSNGKTVLNGFLDNLHGGDAAHRFDVLQTLLDLGADPTQETLYGNPDQDGIVKSAGVLYGLQWRGRAEEAVRYSNVLMLEEADPHTVSPWGNDTAFGQLFSDVPDGSAPVIRGYLRAGVDPNRTELMNMVRAVQDGKLNDDEGLITLTLSRSSHINDTDKYQDTPAHEIAAARWNDPDETALLIRLFLDNGARTSAAPTTSWRHP